MKFTVGKSREWNYKREVEINSLEDIKNLPERFEESFSPDWKPPYKVIINFERHTIEVYDDYRE